MVVTSGSYVDRVRRLAHDLFYNYAFQHLSWRLCLHPSRRANDQKISEEKHVLLSTSASYVTGNDNVNTYFMNVLDNYLASNVTTSHTIIPHSGAATTSD